METKRGKKGFRGQGSEFEGKIKIGSKMCKLLNKY